MSVALTERVLERVEHRGEGKFSSSRFPFSEVDASSFYLEALCSRLDAWDASDPNLYTILGRLEILVDRQEERIQALEGQLEWVQSRQALCPCIQSRTLASVCEGSEEETSEGSGEEVPMSSTSRPVSMTAVGSFLLGIRGGVLIDFVERMLIEVNGPRTTTE